MAELTNLGRVGTPTNHVYIESNGAAQACGFIASIISVYLHIV